MSIFNVLALFGGLAMFLYGMNLMGEALEKRAGNRLKAILAKLTSNQFKGFLLGLGVTAIIQSSSATTVMVVGFVNSGVMNLRQAIGVIMGANLGTSVTSWILSTAGIQGDNLILTLLKPSSFTPVLAFIGIVMYMFMKSPKKKDTGLIFLGFAILMFGMEAMSGAVEPLAQSEQFGRIMLLFSNPILGVLVGTVVTAIIQSSSASVGILQALTLTGSVPYMTAIPIIMGQNIGTCVSAMISSIGATKNARRAAYVHLYFNVIATLILLPLFYIVCMFIPNEIMNTLPNASPFGIAVAHTGFKILALCLLMPFTKQLEKLANLTVRDSKDTEELQILDDRLLTTPPVAIERCRSVACTMAKLSCDILLDSFDLLDNYNEKKAMEIREGEKKVDMYEDKLGTYLVKLSSKSLSEQDSHEISKLLHIIGDFERISDHAVNILKSAEEVADKKIVFSPQAQKEFAVIKGAVSEIVNLALESFVNNDIDKAKTVEPLEQVVDSRSRHL